MNSILANFSASISELKKSPSSIIEEAGSEAVAILNHNKASAYLVPAQTYEKLMAIVDDYLLSKEIDKRMSNGSKLIEVNKKKR